MKPVVAVRIPFDVARVASAFLGLEDGLGDFFVAVVERRIEKFFAREEIAECRLARLDCAENHHDKIAFVFLYELLAFAVVFDFVAPCFDNGSHIVKGFKRGFFDGIIARSFFAARLENGLLKAF